MSAALSEQAPVFLLGVGAQKAGTTWLWNYLKRHPQCAMGTIKEYAVFDAVYRADAFPLRRQHRLARLQHLTGARAAALAAGQQADDPDELLSLMDNIALELDLSRYPGHFDRLRGGQSGARLVGDITPEYCALRAEHFRAIRDMLGTAGYRVKVVFLMRDPVERCYSMLRMGARNAAREGRKGKRPVHERFAEDAVKPWCEIRTRYDHTIEALESAFAPGELHYDFYERFISPQGVQALTAFLGIEYREPNLDFRPNVSPREAEPTPEAIARVRAFYDPVYRFCIGRFGEETINSLWKHAGTIAGQGS